MSIDTNEIEVAVISVLVNHPDSTSHIIASLTANHFNSEYNRAIFSTIETMVKEGKQVNGLTISQRVRADFSIDIKSRCVVILAEAMGAMRFNEPIDEYIAILKDAYISRTLPNLITQEMMNSDANMDGYKVASNIIDKLTKLIDTNSTEDKLISTAELMDDERKLYYEQEVYAKQGKLIGIDTGIHSINEFTGGWQNELIVIAGRPSMGKTALAIFHALSTDEYGVYINCEMSKSQLAQRLILNQSDGSIDGGRLKKRLLTEDERIKMEQSIGTIEQKKLLVYHKPSCGLHEAIRVIKKAHKSGRCKWAVIDYLQLLQLEGVNKGNREQEVSTMIKLLKRCQLDLGIPIILLSQLSREVEKRSTKMPILADLRESGEIEQTADSVVFIWRPAYYKLQDDNGQDYTNEIFYLFEKHRQGAVGMVKFRHNPTMSNFYDDTTKPVFNQPKEDKPVRMPVSSWFETDNDKPF
jgi:replicative DNA helicase